MRTRHSEPPPQGHILAGSAAKTPEADPALHDLSWHTPQIRCCHDPLNSGCLIHLIRNSFRFASRKCWDELSRDLKPIYTAVNAEAAASALDDLDAKWGTRYPAIIRLWRNAWEEFIPFLDYDLEIRKVLCSTNAIESLNARYRRAVKARGHFPTEQAAMKCLYLVTRSLDPKGTGQTRWATRWKPALNAFAITFADRMPTKAN